MQEMHRDMPKENSELSSTRTQRAHTDQPAAVASANFFAAASAASRVASSFSASFLFASFPAAVAAAAKSI